MLGSYIDMSGADLTRAQWWKLYDLCNALFPDDDTEEQQRKVIGLLLDRADIDELIGE